MRNNNLNFPEIDWIETEEPAATGTKPPVFYLILAIVFLLPCFILCLVLFIQTMQMIFLPATAATVLTGSAITLFYSTPQPTA